MPLLPHVGIADVIYVLLRTRGRVRGGLWFSRGSFVHAFPFAPRRGNATYLIVRFHRHVWIHASCGRRRYLGHTPSRDFRRLGYCPAGQVLAVSGRTQLCLDCPYYVGNFFPLHVPRIDGRSLAISGFDAQ